MDSTKRLSVAMIEESRLMPASKAQVSGTAVPCTHAPNMQTDVGPYAETLN